MSIKKIYGEISHIIENNKNFLVVTHIFPDGDALGSASALHVFLKKMKKNSFIICNSGLPYQYEFLPGFKDIKKDFESTGLAKGEFACFCLDCADEERMKLDFENLRKNASVVVNIDHHISNNFFGDVNMVDRNKSATAEMIYDIFYHGFKKMIDYDIALGIYTGILTDTGRFQYSSTTADVHRIASGLLKLGVRPSDIYGYIYENDPINRFKLISRVFKRISYIEHLSLIYSYILKRDFRELDLPFYSQDGIIELLRSAEGAKITVLIKQIKKSSYKVSLRTSERNIDLAAIAVRFSGGGHHTAAAYSDSGNLKMVIKNLEEAIMEGYRK